jgi:hypothetical protein
LGFVRVLYGGLLERVFGVLSFFGLATHFGFLSFDLKRYGNTRNDLRKRDG